MGEVERNGRRVGGELLRYEDAELPEDENDDQAFEKLQQKWPLGHVARVLGIDREELLRIPRKSSALIELNGHQEPKPLWQLFPERVQALRSPQVFEAP